MDFLPAALTLQVIGDGIKETCWRAFLRHTGLESFNLDLVTVLADLKKRLWPLLSAARKG